MKLKYFISFLLILLWIYAASSKLMDFSMFKAQMHRQALFPFLKASLVYLLPPIEITAGVCLVFDSTRKTGLYLSFTMLAAFTIYIAMALMNMLGHIPCSCGGILRDMGWTAHLIFNIFFLLLTAFGIYIDHRERRQTDQ